MAARKNIIKFITLVGPKLRHQLLLPVLPALLAIAHAAPPPAAAYAALPEAGNARMSPDGKFIALIAASGDQLAISVSSLDSNAGMQLPTGAWNPGTPRWKDNQTLLASVEQTESMPDGLPIPTTRLVAIKSDGSAIKPVVFDSDFDSDVEVIGGTNYVMNIQDQLVSTLPDQAGHVLMQVVAPNATDPYPAVYNVDLWSGNKVREEGDFDDVVRWFADRSGVVRAGITRTERDFARGVYDTHIIARASADDDWHKIMLVAGQIAFSPDDPEQIYVLAGEPRRIMLINIATGASSVIATGQVTMVIRNGTMIGIASLQPDGTTSVSYTDPGWARDQASIAGALHLKNVILTDRSDDGMRATAYVAVGDHPAVLYLLDRTVHPANLSPILTDYPDVPADQVAPNKWMNFQARDGLTIPVLVTLPVGAPAGPIPFVVLPHGGPTGRDSGGFDFVAQFLASRGWGVLQPEFRGSTGYGEAFQKAGLRQWGLAMQDDVTDATKWAIAQGMADPNRICIVGMSYGGYAALEGAEKEPSLYRCAAAYAPVTDLPLMLRDNRRFSFGDANIPRVGDDSDQLEATSPDRHADLIQIPVLLIHGMKDFTVPVTQTQRMERALKEAGKTETTIYLPDSTHSLPHVADRLAVLNALEAFLTPVLR